MAAALHERVRESLRRRGESACAELAHGRSNSLFGGWRYSQPRSCDKSLSQKELVDAVIRHQRGDWGLVDEKHVKPMRPAYMKRVGLIQPTRTRTKIEFWVITDYDRAATNVLLPSEY